MKLSDVAEAVQNQGLTTDALQKAVSDLQQALNTAQTEFVAMSNRIAHLEGGLNAASALLEEHGIEVQALWSKLLGEQGDAPENESDEQRATRVGLLDRVEELETLSRGRNRSAPIKRNMTDADARRVLDGDVKDLGHKEAGEAVGLTYAQVYSARLEYTFKHIHKELREKGFKNGWLKKK